MEQGTSSFIDPTGHAQARQLLEGGWQCCYPLRRNEKKALFWHWREWIWVHTLHSRSTRWGRQGGHHLFKGAGEEETIEDVFSDTRQVGETRSTHSAEHRGPKIQQYSNLRTSSIVEPLCGSDLQKHDQAMEQERLLAIERLRRGRSQLSTFLRVCNAS